MQYIGNAFSLGMIPTDLLGNVKLSPVDGPEGQCVSCVGHTDTASVLGVAFNRASITLRQGDVLYVAQLQGGRLPEGVTTLPEGFTFSWVKVEVV
jgi:hypothetical protein